MFIQPLESFLLDISPWMCGDLPCFGSSRNCRPIRGGMGGELSTTSISRIYSLFSALTFPFSPLSPHVPELHFPTPLFMLWFLPPKEGRFSFPFISHCPYLDSRCTGSNEK
ncbi:hypothetical protein TNIN_485041 [Trichonephila inaurata madagascariensis]|uniref:Uncharacterized protein n=1 Tax=Trichonephila inaurata madagascariensis TaxID=2747483 RepID=A0A8X6IDA7_9ARAC|nr:hypothetical protein TNIN_485041 [Trichonephila inaurata madagascariensis]